MKVRQLMIGLLAAAGLLLMTGPVALAQTYTPDVQVADTGIVDGKVTIVRATVIGRGWVVIHADAGGKPGFVIGYAPLNPGHNDNVQVPVNAGAATQILHAVLHVDAGTVIVYEFPGPDIPIQVSGNTVMAMFSSTPVVEE
jgi:hypothetical protein